MLHRGKKIPAETNDVCFHGNSCSEAGKKCQKEKKALSVIFESDIKVMAGV